MYVMYHTNTNQCLTSVCYVMTLLCHVIALVLLSVGLTHCHQKRFRRDALNLPYYQIVPNIERMFDSSELYTHGDGDVDMELVWREHNNIDGDFGLRSSSVPRFKQNFPGKKYGPEVNNRRTRNMKVSKILGKFCWEIKLRYF